MYNDHVRNVIWLLLYYEVNTNVADKFDDTPLEMAMLGGKECLVGLLRSAQASGTQFHTATECD